jgi:hypothetical protein
MTWERSAHPLADLKPPRLVAGGERRTIRLLTQYHRESVDGRAAGDQPPSARLLEGLAHHGVAEIRTVRADSLEPCSSA